MARLFGVNRKGRAVVVAPEHLVPFVGRRIELVWTGHHEAQTGALYAISSSHATMRCVQFPGAAEALVNFPLADVIAVRTGKRDGLTL